MADEEQVRIRAELDQLGAVMRDTAPVLAAFRESLEATGHFTREESLEMAKTLLATMYRAARRDPVDGYEGGT